MFATKSVTSLRQTRLCSPLQCTRTQITKVGDMICVVDFHDLCSRQSLLQSRGLCRKVGVLDFGLRLI